LFTAQQLAQYTSDNPAGGGKIYMAILGEVFDVSSKPNFYGVYLALLQPATPAYLMNGRYHRAWRDEALLMKGNR
jgi:hypothetical protein